MTALLRAEVLKLRTTRTFLAFAGLAVGTSLLIAGLVSLLTEPTQDSVLTDVFTSDTSSLFIIILAVVGISGEWRHRTITSSLLAAPDRVRFLAAKTLAFAVVGLLLSLSISISVAVLGFIILSVRDLPTPGLGELAAQVGHIASEAMLLGAFGVCVGALVRNQVVAVVGLLLLSFVVEPVLIGLVPNVFRYAPFVALPTAVSDLPPDQSGLADVDLLAPGLAVLAMLAWIAVTFAIAAVLLRARDLN
jgi:ABC-2 type transport system permease protein